MADTDLTALNAVSDTLSDFIERHPSYRDALDDADPTTHIRTANADNLGEAWKINLSRIAIDDFRGTSDLKTTVSALSRLADTVLQRAYELAVDEHPGDAELAIVAMGKTGAKELNYISDVDVVFVATGDIDIATRRAEYVCRVVSAQTWQVDPNLRPEGRNGPLVRSLESYLHYLREWAHPWEFQALIKARPAAGNLALGDEWRRTVEPMIWETIDQPSLVNDVRDMRRRVERSVPPAKRKRELKLGPGGLRDIEFAVQLLQLVHGRADAALRVSSTFTALESLVDGGYLARKDGADLTDTYAFLRSTEHRLQLRRLKRTHQIPEPGPALTQLRQSLGYVADEDFERDWRFHAATARRLHEKLLYKPLLDAVASIPTENLRLTTAAASDRLAALGFTDPATALTHIRRLTSGLNRTAVLQRNLLPVVLDELADVPEPDHGLLAYRKVSESLGSTPWYLRFLRDAGSVDGPNSVPPAVTRLARLLGTSRYFTGLLQRSPQALRYLADDADLRPRERQTLEAGMRAAASRHRKPAAAMAAVRAIRRQELLRIAAGDLLEVIDMTQVATALTELTEAVIATAMSIVKRDLEEPLPLAIIAMGRFGGMEMSYGSDADIVAIHNGNPRRAIEVVSQMRDLLSAPSNEPPLELDFGLRPEGKGGALAASWESYRRYFDRGRAQLWERQALLRSRVVIGEAQLQEDLRKFVDSVRYRPGGLSTEELTEFRRLKARVDTERLPRGADRSTHTKLGRGGLVDIEWAVQLLQMRYATVAELHTPSTLRALRAAWDAEIVDEEQYSTLADAWILVSRVRNAMMLTQGAPRDQIPPLGKQLNTLSQYLGYGSDSEEFLNDYRALTRRAHNVAVDVINREAEL
ncbi:bifunctional [glutamine synthetase] adenylyltransferase/[glutamine synthetase]-adenylyl-L-tyrosine phosphorylase [Haloglycomyces albus]|uniref:bifunctional [glutamine synthetase] adenylyltransferase/[glutamine synthetase]-adenylyl-L-tyrosine phosphorylase n=1 Tax=Haloglycomyces albus TaxID=526067 RepID=UPI00046CC593|nr:bifunctional [glutamine synthetase] adenylyltransferase/[glutamine synthetase]-adenylyl-L-tyrosine phosphorylase [Haloglycomyces albus]